MPVSRREFLLAAAAQVAPTTAAHFWTLTQAVGEIRAHRVSSVALTQHCITRIHEHDKRLNAFLTITADTALETAAECDSDLKRGVVRGPLHGVPIALKDNIDTAGVRTSAASQIFAERIPQEDAEVAARLKKAGAVLLGKLNLDEFAFAGTGTTGSFGPSRNPWNTDHITGGSSSGSAAALAAGLCFASVGSDDGGSIRIPASHCGIVGLKASYRRVSTRGVIPSAYSLDCVGPMCRSVADAALMLNVLAGYDPQDSITVDTPVPDYTRALLSPIAGLRVGVPRAYFFEQLHPDVSSAVEAAIKVVGAKVKSVRDMTLPPFQFVEGGSIDIELYHYHREMFEKWPDKYHPSSRKLLEAARGVSAERYVETLKRIREARRDIGRVFQDVDVLLLPTMREPAPLLAKTIDGTHRRPPSNVAAFNRFGTPALSVPCGFSRDGLPIGLQIVGPAFKEARVLAVGHAYERATEWHRRHPVT